MLKVKLKFHVRIRVLNPITRVQQHKDKNNRIILSTTCQNKNAFKE